VANGADIILAETDAFHMADITLNKKLLRHFSLSAGVRNIFDTDRIQSSFTSGGIHTTGGLNVGTGRSFFTGLVFNWEKK
jgi:outer membrane receptor for ferrienterochelin and colicins